MNRDETMNKRILQMAVVALLALCGLLLRLRRNRRGSFSNGEEKTESDKLVGQSVDIAPWAYAWRADRAVQEKPEAYFIPRRLERLDKVYRTAFYALSAQT